MLPRGPSDRITTRKYLCVVKYLTIGARTTIVMKMKNATVVSINERAVENLKYIRETLESAGSFTAVPGWGGILMRVSALLTSLISCRLPTSTICLDCRNGEVIFSHHIMG